MMRTNRISSRVPFAGIYLYMCYSHSKTLFNIAALHLNTDVGRWRRERKLKSSFDGDESYCSSQKRVSTALNFLRRCIIYTYVWYICMSTRLSARDSRIWKNLLERSDYAPTETFRINNGGGGLIIRLWTKATTCELKELYIETLLFIFLIHNNTLILNVNG